MAKAESISVSVGAEIELFTEAYYHHAEAGEFVPAVKALADIVEAEGDAADPELIEQLNLALRTGRLN